MYFSGGRKMEKRLGVLLMVVFGVSGVGLIALAWLYPSIGLDKLTATAAGIIGVGFTIFQGLRFILGRHSDIREPSLAVTTNENP